MNNTLNTIYERRAVRKYKDQPVNDSLLEQLIDAGRMAPSSMNRQLCKFYIVNNRSLISEFSIAIAKEAGRFFNWAHGVESSETDDIIFHNAPVVIFIASPKNDDWGLINVGVAAQNILLAAKSLGLATCPVGLGKFIQQTNYISKFGLSESEEIQFSIVVGHGNENPIMRPRRMDNLKFI